MRPIVKEYVDKTLKLSPLVSQFACKFSRCCKLKKEFSPIPNDSDHVMVGQDELEAKSNEIYKGRSIENGQPTFEKEMKCMNSGMGSGEV